MSNKTKLQSSLLVGFLITIAVGTLPLVGADVVFSDGFENGSFANWAISRTPGIVTPPGVEGNYSAQFKLGSSASYIQTAYPQTNQSTLQFYFLTDTTALFPNSGITFAMIINSQSVLCSLALWRQLDGELVWVFFYALNSRTIDTKIAPAHIQADTWYKLSIAVSLNVENGGYQFSIDDKQVFSVGGIVNFTWNPTVVRLGAVSGTGPNSGKIYLDSVTISNSTDFTPPTPTEAPSILPSSTPTITPSPSFFSSQTPITTKDVVSPFEVSLQTLVVGLGVIGVALFVFAVALIFRRY